MNISPWEKLRNEMDKVKRIAKELVKSKKLLIFTGAGLSAPSVHKRFSEPLIPEIHAAIKTRNYYDTLNSDYRMPLLAHLFDSMLLILDAQPNEGHKAIATLVKFFEIKRDTVEIITQNIDYLQELAALTMNEGNQSALQNIIHIHGWLKTATCPKCGKKHDFHAILKELKKDKTNIALMLCSGKAGEGCDGRLSPDDVDYGEPIPELEKCDKIAKNSDTVLVVGSSLKVEPANDLVEFVHQRGGKVFEFNLSDTKLERLVHQHVHGDLQYSLPALIWELKKEMLAQFPTQTDAIEKIEMPDIADAMNAIE